MARKSTDYIIIHCAATKSSQTNIDAREIDRWHRQRGFLCIGYQWVIKRDGTIEKGRDLNEPGAHTEGYNSRSVGICMVGGLDESGKPAALYEDAQWASLEKLVREMRDIWPDARIAGHNEFSAKACPSFDVQEWVKKVGLSNP